MAKDAPGGQAEPKEVPLFIQVWTEQFDTKNEAKPSSEQNESKDE